MATPDYSKLMELMSNEKEPFGTKLRKLNNFIKTIAESIKSESDQDKYINSIQIPSTNQDFFAKKLKLELANALRRLGPIIEILKDDDKLFVYRAIRFTWIYTDSKNSPLINDPNFLVKEVFPVISYSCRMKIVCQMSKLCLKSDAETITKIYSNIEQTYGIHIAKYLIPTCDQSTIDSVIKEKRIPLSTNQVLAIYKKYPESALKFLEEYYEDLTKDGSRAYQTPRFDPRDILRLLVKDNPKEFMNFVDKYPQISIQLGPRSSTHLLRYDTPRIIKSAQKYAKLLHQSQIIKRFPTQEYDQFLATIFPENISNFQASFELAHGNSQPLFTWLAKYPPTLRFDKLNLFFQKCYNNKSIFDFPELITSRMIQLINKEDRDKWIDLRLSLPDAYSQYLYRVTSGNIPVHREGYWEAFRATDKSIPKIKQYLATESDVHRRADLLSYLVLTCSLNKDIASLKEICQFASARYRNDNVQVRLDFLEQLNTLFDLSKLEEGHWAPINELLHIASINNEFSHRVYILESILEKSILFRVKNDLPVDTQIQHYIKMKSRVYCRGESWCVVSTSGPDPKVEMKCLKLFADHLSSLYPLTTPCPSDSASTSAIISLFESFSGWNRRTQSFRRKSKNTEFQLWTATENPWLMKRLQEVLESYHEHNKFRVIQAIKFDLPTKAILLPKLIKSSQVPCMSELEHYLLKEPEQLDQCSEEILSFLLRSNGINGWGSFLQKLRSSGLSQLLEQFVNKCLEIAEDDDESLKERTNSIYILSHLLKPKNFVDWISKFYPEESKIESYSEEANDLNAVRKTITKCLKNLTIPSAGIPVLLQFCKGDYLKLVVGALYSISLKSAITPKLLDFLKELSSRPVSVKKHAIRLMITISCKSENILFLKNLWETEKHHSIRIILFNRIFEFFLQNNSEESWELLTSAINSLTMDDRQCLGEMGRKDYITSKDMPTNKLSDYLQLVITKLDQVGDSIGPEVNWVRVSILQCISQTNIKFISEQFLQSMFDQHLFLLDDQNIQSYIVNVAVTYLLHYPSPNKLDVITKYLKRLTLQSWNTLSKDSLTLYPAKQSLSYFVEQLAIESFKIQGELNPEIKNLFSNLQTSLRESRDHSEYFVDDLFLHFSKIFHSLKISKNSQDELISIGKEVGKLVDQTVETFRPEVVGVFSETVKRFISLCYKYRLIEDGGDGARIILIIEGILESTGSVDTKIVASNLLLQTNSHFPKGHKFEAKYVEMVKKLKEVEDRTVKVFVNYRLTQCRQTRGYDVLV